MDSMIFDTENLILSPSNRAKLRNKNAAMKLKNGSPKLSEVLRHRCRTRLKQQRTTLFNNQRQLFPVDPPADLSSIMQQEWKELYETLSDDDSGFSSQSSLDEALAMYESWPAETLSPDEEDWLRQECDRIVDTNMLDSLLDDRVICPLCLKEPVVELQAVGLVSCPACGECIPAPHSMKGLKLRIDTALAMHNQVCRDTPSFNKIDDGTNNLYIVCGTCSYMDSIS